MTETDLLPEPGNGHAEPETSEQLESTEEPAQVELKIKGSDKSARSAARRFGGDVAKTLPVTTPANDVVPPDDTDALLADGHNMVLVRRTFPKSVEMADGSKRRCATKLPDRYDCPTSREKIENDVFDRYGGSEYKCTIHPATTNGEATQLGFFTIEHPNPDEGPFFPDDPPEEHPFDPRTDIITRGSDPTMRETDGLSKLRADAERRVERARILKETRELEREAKRLEDEIDGSDKKPVAPVPVGESDEVRKLREENERLRREAEAKKVDDRFATMQSSIVDLTKSVADLVRGGGVKPAASGDDSIVMKMLTQSQQHAKDMIELVKDKGRPAASSDGADFDKLLDRMTKLQAITGTGPNKSGTRMSELENRLIEMSFDRLTGGGDGGEDGDGDTEDVAKLAVKEFAPILKTFVEKKMEQENAASGGAPLTKEKLQQIYGEAAQAAAKKVTDDLAIQGITLAQAPDGRLIALQAKPGTKGVVPPRATTKVMSEHRTSGGVVKKISIEPANLSGKPKVAEEAAAPSAETKKENEMPKRGEFPGLGEGGATVYIDFPQRPGEIKYDRKYSVDFVLDGIRSEIRQGLPQKSLTDKLVQSYAVADAIQYLDDEILDSILAVDSGAQLEALLSPWGEAGKISEIKTAGQDETVSSYLRKLVLSIQREWQAEKHAGTSQG